MKLKLTILRLSVFLLFLGNARGQSSPKLIPLPVKMQKGTGTFKLNATTAIVVSAKDQLLNDNAELLSEQLSAPTGYKLKVKRSVLKGEKAIYLELNKDNIAQLGIEGYRINVQPTFIKISANKPAGIFYGMQSLMQLLPAEIEKGVKAKQAGWDIPVIAIDDYPRFGWRGLLLDVSRHFFSKEFVKKYIDQMAKYKFNVLHWHLTDDPGWRIEIKKYPKLTNVGAWRVPRTGNWETYGPPEEGEEPTYGGFYSQEDVKEIIKYAQDRFVTIVPEIDVPSHTMAMITAYPEVSSSGYQNMMYPGSKGGMGENVLCMGKDETFVILEGIIDEIAALFPGQYIHAGGDEINLNMWTDCEKCKVRMADNGLKTGHELQSYFMKRVEKMISSRGKKMIGWDEILEGELAPGTTVMSWRGQEGGIKAAKLGHDVIMCPLLFSYLDFQQSDGEIERTGSRYIKLSDTYKFEPVPDGVDSKYILGGQGNLWTEFVSTPSRAEYMVWPRAFALSEVLWSPKRERDFNGFVSRVESQFPRFLHAGVNYSGSIYDPHIIPLKVEGGGMQISFHKEIPDIDVYYTFDSSYPDFYSTRFDGKPIDIPKGASEIRAITYRNGKLAGRLLTISMDNLKKRL